MRSSTTRLARFCGYFLPHVLVAPLLLLVGVTFLHELAHAGVALALGGRVNELVFLPDGQAFGHMRWDAPPGAGFVDHALVSVAPYLMWSAVAAAVLAFAALPNRLHWLAASTLFLWGYVVPLGDIAGNLFAGAGDLYVPGPDGLLVQGVGAGLLLVAAALGYWLQRRLFGERAVGVGGYLASAVVLAPAFGAAALLGLLAV